MLIYHVQIGEHYSDTNKKIVLVLLICAKRNCRRIQAACNASFSSKSVVHYCMVLRTNKSALSGDPSAERLSLSLRRCSARIMVWSNIIRTEVMGSFSTTKLLPKTNNKICYGIIFFKKLSITIPMCCSPGWNSVTLVGFGRTIFDPKASK